MTTPTLFAPDRLTQARALFPHIEQGVIYLNHAATSPLSTKVVAAMSAHLQERSTGEIDNYHASVRTANLTKELVCRLIQADSPDRIALVGNTSDALNIIASGLKWKAGDRILLNDLEFPANVYPYYHLKRHGVVLDVIKTSEGKITTEMIESGLKPTTRIVALSAVQFLTGYRAALGEVGKLCREKGILFVVDGIQAVGAMTVDVQAMHIDALASGGQKWQMGPQGTGFLYLTEALQSRIEQQYLGWLAPEDPWDFFNFDQPLASSARRYEGGTLNFVGITGLHASLSTLLEFGVNDIEAHILALTERLIRELQSIDGILLVSPFTVAERAGIVTIKLPEWTNASETFQALNSGGIKSSLREGKLRFSPHFYNTPDEVATTVDALRECLKQKARMAPV